MEYVEKYLRSVISRILFSAVEIMNRDERKILRSLRLLRIGFLDKVEKS